MLQGACLWLDSWENLIYNWTYFPDIHPYYISIFTRNNAALWLSRISSQIALMKYYTSFICHMTQIWLIGHCKGHSKKKGKVWKWHIHFQMHWNGYLLNHISTRHHGNWIATQWMNSISTGYKVTELRSRGKLNWYILSMIETKIGRQGVFNIIHHIYEVV